MSRRLSPYKHGGEVVWPKEGYIPVTVAEDVATVIWSYTEAKVREYHVQVMRRSDNQTLTHVKFKVRR